MGSQLTEDERKFLDPAEAKRAWDAALVRVPGAQGGVIETTVAALEDGSLVPDKAYPVVVWMHGCSGFWSGTYDRINWLAQNGFAVFAPRSPARAFYPASCDTDTFESGLYRPTLRIRHLDVDYALSQISQLDWANQDQLFLAGLSEGAATTTTYKDDSVEGGYLKARLAEAWTCHSGWREYVGIEAPKDQAILTLVADSDPWYTAPYHQGDCARFMEQDNGSQSIVIDYAPARHLHELWEQAEIRELMLNFLLEQINR